MKKAKHSGECQLCGRTQKLPNGVLSNHGYGYSVEWNMFTGTCPGSKELPYEQSCELIKLEIPIIAKRIEVLENTIAELVKPATTSKCRHRVFAQEIYQVVWGELIEEKHKTQHGYKWVELYFVCEIEGKIIKQNVRSNSKVLVEAATELNKVYAEEQLGKNLRELQQYLKWRKERVTKWKLKELQPLSD